MFVCKRCQSAYFGRSINSAEFCTLADIDCSRLRMVFHTKINHIRFQEFRCQFSIGSGDSAHEASGRLAWRSTFVYCNMCSVGTKYNMIRASHQLQCHRIATCSIKDEQRFTRMCKLFFYFSGCLFCPRVITITEGMVCVCRHQCFHYLRMYTGIVVGCKTSHNSRILNYNFRAKLTSFSSIDNETVLKYI